MEILNRKANPSLLRCFYDAQSFRSSLSVAMSGLSLSSRTVTHNDESRWYHDRLLFLVRSFEKHTDKTDTQ